MNDRIISYRLFVDGVSRPVYLDAAGKQDIVGPDGDRVPGVRQIRGALVVDLSQTHVTDADLALLAELPGLCCLDGGPHRVRGAGSPVWHLPGK